MHVRESEEFFSGIKGRTCWSVIAGKGAGSNVSFRFGQKLPAKHPLNNPSLSMEERLFEGERSLIVYCAWRLELDDSISATSQGIDGETLDLGKLLALRNRRVTEISFASPVHDLRLQFVDGYMLTLFCDAALGSHAGPNYVMFNPSTTVSVSASGQLVVEQR